MNKVYVGIASLGFVVVASMAGCSSAETPTPGTAGSSTTPSTAGTTANPPQNTAGTGVVAPPTGGTPGAGSGGAPAATGGVGGTAGADTGGTPAATGGMTGTAGMTTGTGGTGAPGVGCMGVKSNMACTVEGTECPGLPCGLGDSGVRSCKCQSTWMCAACDYTNSPFKDKPADITTCTSQADKVACVGMENKVCEGAPGGEVCACALNSKGSYAWDCDKPPTTWPK